MRIENYIGRDGFYWWIGVIENRRDPLKLGRYQVRILSWHTDSKIHVPSEDLPWAGFSSVGTGKFQKATEGTWVWGFFQDGEHGQHPMIAGVMNGIPETTPLINKGFSDQRTNDILASSPRPPQSVKYNTDGTGATVTEASSALRYPFILNESTISRLARNENIDQTFIQTRKNNVVTNVPVADGSTWNEPVTAYSSVYPYNDVNETESGHIVELDDTPGAERIHKAHRTGTFEEIYPDGSKVVKVVKNNYEIIMADDHVYIMGNANITTKGNINIYAQENITVKGGTITLDGSVFNAKLNGAAPSDLLVLVSKMITIFNNHFHKGVQSGVGVSGTPSTPIQASDISSTTFNVCE